MIDVETFGQQPVQCLDHVQVTIPWKPGAQPVAWPARLTVPNSVGKDDEVARSIEQSTRHKQHTRKLRSQELRPAAAGAVQNEDGIAHNPLRVARGRAHGPVMDPQVR